MILKQTTQDVLKQLALLLRNLTPEEYASPIAGLSSATIGQHIRHVIEGFSCFLEGYEQGNINYDKRKRDKILESSQIKALGSLEHIDQQINKIDLNKSLMLEVNYHQDNETTLPVTSSAGRELAYNIEHAIHHMALIKVGLREICPHICLPSNFGIGYSTLKHNSETCAQ